MAKTDFDDFTLGDYLQKKEETAVTGKVKRRATAVEQQETQQVRTYNKAPTKKMLATRSTVAKSNELVQASYKLTLDEQRLILCAISKVKREQEPGRITVTAKDYAQAYDININTAYAQLQRATHKLYERDIKLRGKWQHGNDGEETRLRWLQRITVEKGAGQVTVYFNTQLQQFIFQLKNNFTKYKQEYIRNLTSTYAIRLYELLQQYLKFGERRFEVDELRELLGLQNKYTLWADFRKWCILPSIKQINTHTNIEIATIDKAGNYYAVEKRGKKVIALTLYFNEKRQQSLL